MLSGKVRAILAVAVTLTACSHKSVLSVPQALASEAACQLAKSDKIPSDTIYSIQGTYLDDWEHGSILEVPSCDLGIWPKLDDNASAKVAQYHFAFKEKCGGTLINDVITGVFTGKFVAGKIQTQWGTIPGNIFIISSIDSKQLDIASITCPK